MTRTSLTVLWLTLVWVALWESLTVANLLGGLAVAALVTALVPLRRGGDGIAFRPFATVRLFGFFAWELIKASAQVAWEIVTPGDNTSPAVVSVPLTSTAPGIITMVANMVSLTPGTLTIDVDTATPPTLFIHVLHHPSGSSTLSDVQRLEALTLSAFPPRGDHR